MLRRKLLVNLGPLVVLLLLTGVAAVWLLQGVLRDLDHVESRDWRAVEDVSELHLKISAIEVDLYELLLKGGDVPAHLPKQVAALRGTINMIGTVRLEDEQCRQAIARLTEQAPGLEAHIRALMLRDSTGSASDALAATRQMRQAALPLGWCVRDHAHRAQEAISTRFRWLVLGIAAVFVIVVNVAVVVLLRLGMMVLRPVDKLLIATRQLEHERFDYRVTLDQHDEFDELARAFNSLAEQLGANHDKRLETLAQAAVTMNHELNNALAAVDLQLAKLGRQNPGSAPVETCLREIRLGIQRVTTTVRSLGNVRQIVLTDYIPGTKMLDLERSTRLAPQERVIE